MGRSEHWLRLVACLALAHLGMTVSLRAQLVYDNNGDKRGQLPSFSRGLGTRALGMGGAFIAVADDSTAAFWNPAGLGLLEKREASAAWQAPSSFGTRFAGLTEVFSTQHFQDVGIWAPHTLSATSQAFDFASLTLPLRLGRFRLVPQISYQRVVDYGLESSDSQFRSGRSESSSSQYALRTSTHRSGGIDVVAGSVGLGLGRRLFLGIGVNHWTGVLRGSARSEWDASQVYPGDRGTQFGTSEVATEERIGGTNVNLGVLLQPSQKLSLGLVFKSSFDLTSARECTHRVSLTATGEDPFSGNDNWEERPSEGRTAWPRTLGAGVALRPNKSLTLSADLTLSRWSQAERREGGGGVYGDQWPTLVSNYYNPERPGYPRQANTRQLRLGGEYVLRRPRIARLQALPLRAGVFRDRQLFKTLALGDVDFLGLTAGFGLVWSRVSLDWAYVNVRGDYKCCEWEHPLTGLRVSQDGSDRFRSQRFYVSSSLTF